MSTGPKYSTNQYTMRTGPKHITAHGACRVSSGLKLRGKWSKMSSKLPYIGSPNRFGLVDGGHLLDHLDGVSHARLAGAGAGAWAHLIRGRRLRVQMNMQS